MGWQQLKYGMNTNQIQLPKTTAVGYCGVLIFRQTMSNQPEELASSLLIRKKKECKEIDFVIPYDSGADAKEVEKIETYQDLAQNQRIIENENSHSYHNRAVWGRPQRNLEKD